MAEEPSTSRLLADLFPAAYTPHIPPKEPHGVFNEEHFGDERAKPRNRPLSTRVRMILSLELRGKTKLEIAQQMGMRAESVYHLTKTERYIEARDVLLAKMDSDFAAMKPAAFLALGASLRSRDENVALRASEAWMKAAGFGQYGRGNGALTGVTAEDVARQLLQVNININTTQGGSNALSEADPTDPHRTRNTAR